MRDTANSATMCSLEKRGKVYILKLQGEDDHCFNATSLDAIAAALKTVDDSPDAGALVTTNEGRYLSNGLDLRWIGEDPAVRQGVFRDKFEGMLAAFMRLGVPMVAAVCGHAAAGGFIVAMALDYRFMVDGLSLLYGELDHIMPVPRSLMAVISSKLSPPALRGAVLGAAKLRADAALERGIVDGVCADAAATLETAVALAERLAAHGWRRDVYRGIRMGAFPGVVDELEAHRDPYGLFPPPAAKL